MYILSNKMGGGLMQLVAYGAQDIYLTGNPQITFFKVVYRRHTNFSMEAIQQTINGSSTLVGASNTTGTVTVSRNGDLVSKIYVRCDQDTTALTGINGDELISDVTLEIGGQQIDKHTKEWLQVWAELSTPDSKAAGYKYLTGGFSNSLVTGGGTSQQSVMVPLQFYFCRNPGLALPLIALQYHEVKLKFTWGTGNNVSRGATDVTITVEVWCDYIYLDTEERRRFAQVSHEYLIEQLQYQDESSSAASKVKLNFNHPVKELVWTETTVAAERTKLTLNGHDRFAEQDREYFQLRQPLDHHTAVPGYNIKETDRPVMLSTPLQIAQSAAPNAPNGHTTSTANKVFIAAESNDVSVISMHATGAPTGSSQPKVGDIVSVLLIDPTSGATERAACSLHQVTLGYSGVTFSVTPGLPVSTETDFITIAIVARIQDPQSRCSQLARNVSVYSFALKPEEHQPSGTCNFSRIDTAYLQFSSAVAFDTTNLTVYAVNYNVLRVMSGMGGLAYSN
jgi:hypothetical protein